MHFLPMNRDFRWSRNAELYMVSVKSAAVQARRAVTHHTHFFVVGQGIDNGLRIVRVGVAMIFC